MPLLTKQVSKLVHDRLNDRINDDEFVDGLKTAIRAHQGQGDVCGNTGASLAKWARDYLYLLTDSIDPRIARGPKWELVLLWVRGNLAPHPIKDLYSSWLQPTLHKADFQSQLAKHMSQNSGSAEFIESVRNGITACILDYFFALADRVDRSIRTRFQETAASMAI